MKTSVMMLAAGLSAGISLAAEIPFTVMPLGIGSSAPTEEAVKTIREVHARAGISRFVLHAPGHGVRISGYYDTAGYHQVGKRVRAIQEALKDEAVEVGFLMGPTMNVGINHPWQKFIRSNGQERAFTACPGDPAFRQAFAERCAACAEECRPFLYMMEDDYRYFFSGCFCDAHLRRFSVKTGGNWTRETLSAALAKAENDALRAAWDELQTGDLIAVAAAAEQAIHAASPETRIGLSAPGGARDDCTAAIARTLAGGRDRPLVRWWGTVYGYDTPLDISGMLFSAQWSKENVSEGIECVYEADACPNSAFYGSGARLGASCSAMLASGFDGLWYWAAALNSMNTGDPMPNVEEFRRNSARWLALQNAVRGGHTIGVSAAFNPATRLAGMFGAANDGHYIDAAAAGRLFARMGLPYTTRPGAVTVYTGYWAFEGMSDAELERLLSGRVLLDGAAAEMLAKRGFSSLTGVKAEARDRVDFTGEAVAATGILIESTFHQNYGLDDARVSRLALAGAEAVSSYYSEKPADIVQPSVTRFVNAKGGRVAVLAVNLAGCTAVNVYNYRKRALLVETLEWLGGKDVFTVRTDRDVNLFLTVNEDDAKSRLVLHALNLSCDVRGSASFVVAPAYRGGAVEILDGSVWRKAGEAVWNGDRLTVPAKLNVFDTLIIRLNRNGN